MDPASPDETRRPNGVSSILPEVGHLKANGNGVSNGSTNGTSRSRPTSHASNHTSSYVPSYMAHVPSRSQASSLAINVPKTPAQGQSSAVELPATEVRTAAPRGLLLVLAAGDLHRSTLSYIEMLVSRQNFSGIMLVASHGQEDALKALKMDCFALIGRLSKEMSVNTHFQDQWNPRDVEHTVQEITKTDETFVQGVICCAEFDRSEKANADVLSMSTDQLQQAWTRSVGFVHGAAKAITAHLLLRCKSSGGRKPVRAPHGPFFLVAGSPALSEAGQIATVALDTLLAKLEKVTKQQGLTVAYAEDVLIPDPVQTEDTTAATSGPFLQPAQMHDQRDIDFATPESPTKLWALWSGNIE